jgi:hypothetical protein
LRISKLELVLSHIVPDRDKVSLLVKQVDWAGESRRDSGNLIKHVTDEAIVHSALEELTARRLSQEEKEPDDSFSDSDTTEDSSNASVTRVAELEDPFRDDEQLSSQLQFFSQAYTDTQHRPTMLESSATQEQFFTQAPFVSQAPLMSQSYHENDIDTNSQSSSHAHPRGRDDLLAMLNGGMPLAEPQRKRPRAEISPAKLTQASSGKGNTAGEQGIATSSQSPANPPTKKIREELYLQGNIQTSPLPHRERRPSPFQKDSAVETSSTVEPGFKKKIESRESRDTGDSSIPSSNDAAPNASSVTVAPTQTSSSNDLNAAKKLDPRQASSIKPRIPAWLVSIHFAWFITFTNLHVSLVYLLDK